MGRGVGALATVTCSQKGEQMRKVKVVTVIAALAIAVVVVVATTASPGMDPVAVAPQAFTEKLNTDKARVLEYTSKPGDKEAMHSHPAGILIVVNGGKSRSTTPDGQNTDTDYRTGTVVWRDAITHSGQNVGTTKLKAFLI
jgi:quercetin dioxygenase-like cupin family protein